MFTGTLPALADPYHIFVCFESLVETRVTMLPEGIQEE